ncbi:MAG: type II toxin-antitoxin system RelE/ParE family toxin [Cyanobacteria bacterium P01_F01_bin.53]
MTYRIDLSSTAKAEADAAFLRFAKFTEPERAQNWYQELMTAIASLQNMPRRCSLAPENSFFTQEIRQLIYGKGKSTYRIIFTVLDDQPVKTVRILHIRNATQRPVGEAES